MGRKRKERSASKADADAEEDIHHEEDEEEFIKKATNNKDFKEFKTKTHAQVWNILNDTLPKKIELIQSQILQFTINPMTMEKLDAQMDANDIPIDQQNTELVDQLTEDLSSLIDTVSGIKTWSRFNLPKAEDAHTYEHTVQKEILNILQGLESAGAQVLKTLMQYNVKRGLYISKAFKHRGVEDYKMAVIMLDETNFLLMQRWRNVLESLWVIVFDLFQKNWEAFTNREAHTSLTSSSSSISSSPSTGSRRRRSGFGL